MDFLWDPWEQEWQEKYQQLLQYSKENGNTKVPREHPKLGTWVVIQRRQRALNRLTEERIQLLESIDFTWHSKDELWNENYLKLKEYIKVNGHSKVPNNYPVIGSWVCTQRKEKRSSRMSLDRIQMLNEIEFTWDPAEEEWQDYYSKLKKYIKQNGHANVPNRYPEIGAWVSRQRESKKRGRLIQEHVLLLEKVGFIWDPIEEEWKRNYCQLKQYIQENNHTKIHFRYPILNRWTHRQREDKKSGKLTESRIKLLEDIGFVWDPLVQEWQEQYQLLKQYFRNNGDTRVPQSNPTLGNWVSSQRSAKSKGKLSEERIRLLDEVGFIWDASNN